MKKNIKLCTMVLIMCLVSCREIQAPKHFVSAEILDGGDNVELKSDSLNNYKFSLSINGNVFYNEKFSDEYKINILKALRSSKENLKDFALGAIKNEGKLNIRLQVNELIDTSFVYHIPPENVISANASFTGIGASLFNSSSNPNDEIDIKRWLFKKKEYMPDSLIHELTAYYRTLIKSDYDEYRTQATIPVVHSVDGATYKVCSTMTADYYALLACSNQKFIDDFVERVVGNGFKGLITSLNQQLICHQKRGTSGYKCLMLVGINKDWSYIQQPIGLIALDSSAPRNCFYTCTKNEVNNIDFKNGMRIVLPSNKPKVFGNAGVSVDNWAGNGLECNVTFRVFFSGDVKSVAIQRRGELCYKQYSGGYYLKQEDKMIYADQHRSPYVFTYKMHFDDGDNIIPIIYEDYRGNKSTSKVRVRAEFVRNNTPDINIDNNIDIYN